MASYRGVFTVECRQRWWLRHYLCAVVLVSVLTGLEPDWPKVECWIRRGLVLRSVRVRAVVAA